MARPKLNRPTDAELQILNVLWQRAEDGCTVREVYLALKKLRGSGYNSALKLIQIMHDKRLVRRDDSQRPQIYFPVEKKHVTQKRMLEDLVRRVYDGNTKMTLEHLATLAMR